MAKNSIKRIVVLCRVRDSSEYRQIFAECIVSSETVEISSAESENLKGHSVEYVKAREHSQLKELGDRLMAVGFSEKAIAKAVKNMEWKTE